MLYKLVFIFVVLAPAIVHCLDPAFNDDVLGLIMFKAGIQDPKSKLTSWNEDASSPCNWVGVKCDPKTNRVTELVLDGFSLSGHIDRGLLRLQFLQILSLSNNNFTGTINPDLAHLGTLQVVNFSENKLSGDIPDGFFQQCGSLKVVSFARNNLTGNIPDSLSSCSTLVSVNFSSNRILGNLPSGLWYLRGLQALDLSDNLLEGVVPEGIEGLYDLRAINLSSNRFSGKLPWDIGGCFLLKLVDFSDNFLSESLPESMQRLSSCTSLSLSGNSFTGEIPNWIGELRDLEILDLSANNFSGNLPESMTNCVSLLAVDVSHNQLAGSIPSWFFKPSVQSVSLSGKRVGESPEYSSLTSVAASHQGLQESSFCIPSAVGGAVSLKELMLQKNFLTGKIPTEIEKCSSLTSLILYQNNLTGPIPSAVANLTNLEYVDLSLNQLSGSLPKELTNLTQLVSFNISHNHLQGELPVGGFFNTISPSSVFGNPSLCGSVVNRSCPSVHPKPLVLNPNSSNSSPGSSSSQNHHKILLSISALIAIGAAVFIALGVVAVTVLNIRVRSSMSHSAAPLALSGGEDYSCSPINDPNYGKLVMFSGDADFVAGAHALLNKDCELGRGGFGVVYRTVLRDGRSVAIKKLTISGLIKSQEEFDREVKKLGKIRHHNLVALEGYYWTPSLQLLIYEYISSGSLYKHLHDGHNGNCLSWRQRFHIVLGMAKGLAHLHQMNIIHYNLKSTNVLIDSSGEPKVGDFGLARLLPMLDRCVLSSKIQSALGYMAPEFACRTVKITEKCDVYGFGVLVLEVVTGKRPVEYMEDDVVVLCDMVREALEEGKVEDCVDGRLRRNFPAEEAIPVIKLGLICASQVPSNRPDMSEVVNILELIQCPSEGQEELE
ncbi:hypothetical protein CMV_019385 [Castanea mollissima]|uniref:Protein kinase domain-containing protein n=1 Tax=Castanea mollissima TaxID=60419 RepID=A0A8J4QN54_9ROSI|nr:hypothetical protein CMV_019385 [Castanea mollissima]